MCESDTPPPLIYPVKQLHPGQPVLWDKPPDGYHVCRLGAPDRDDQDLICHVGVVGDMVLLAIPFNTPAMAATFAATLTSAREDEPEPV